MGDRVAQFIVGVGGDDADLRSIFSSIKSRLRSDVAELEKITNSADLFSQLSTNLPKVEQAMQRATQRAAELKDQIQKIESAGGTVPEALAKEFTAAEKAIAAATKEFARQSTEMAGLNAKLKTAGVDTANLATEQVRLAKAITAANEAAVQQSAKDLLGFKSLKDVQPEIAKVTSAFETLRSSGKLSAAEIAAAQKLANDRVKELEGSVSSAGFQFKELGGQATSALASLTARVLAPAAAFTAVTAGIKASIEAAHEYHDSLTAIDTVSNLTTQQLHGLGEQARALSVELGLNLSASLKAVFELIRSGVAPENAIDVLRASAIAAKASLTDIGTAVKAANTLISAFGVPVTEVGRALDVVVRGAKDGGPTLTEFANGAGGLLAVARAANVPLTDLAATLAVMTNATGDAGGSIAALEKIIVKLDTAEARQKLHDLGIEGGSLVTIFTELGRRNLGLNAVLDLGVASTRSAVGVAALTRNSAALGPELDRLNTSAGTAAEGLRKFLDSPKDRTDKFNSALDDVKVRIGENFGPGSVIIKYGTLWLKNINDEIAALERFQAIDAKSGPFAALKSLFVETADAAKTASVGLDAASASTSRAAEETAAAAAKVGAAKKDLAAFGAELATQSAALQQAAARDISDINIRADEQIAALDRSLKATAETAAKTLDIQTKAAAEKLKILTNAELAISRATQAAITAREKLARESGGSETKIAQDSANARLAALQPVLAAYQAHYTQLTAIAQQNAAKLDSIDRERVSFNEDIQLRLRTLRNEGLSDFDVYVQKVRDAEDLIRKAREAGANGDIALAKKYTDQAIALSDSVKTAVNADGTVIVSALDVQQTKIGIITKAAEAYNSALSTAGESAKKGADAFSASAADVAEKMRALQLQYDDLKTSVAAGIKLKVEIDQQSLNDAIATLQRLSAPITVNVGASASGAPPAQQANGGPVGFRTGGYVPRGLGSAIGPVAQAYAAGGHVFRRPPWRKVPGSGNGDTVPAMLQAGSFVIRKQASQAYGDGLMGALASGLPVRRFASGGSASNSPDFREGGSLPVPKLPSNPDELKRTVLRYVTDIKAAALGEGYFYWRASLDALGYAMSWYERFPTEENLLAVLQRARNIGLNLGASKGTLEGFDVDGKKWHKSRVNISGQLQSIFNYEFFKRGGQANAGTDSVRALLTPGEWVIPKRAASALGGNLLQAINSMSIAPRTLASMMARTSMPPPRRFETGGLVPGAAILNGPSAAGMRSLTGQGGDMNVNIYAHPGALLNRENFLRYIAPEIEALLRRSGKTLG